LVKLSYYNLIILDAARRTLAASFSKLPEMKIIVCFFIFPLFFINICNAQIDTIIWQTCLGTQDGENDVHTVAINPKGYLVGIHITKNGPGIYNYHDSGEAWIVKCTLSGEVLWNRCYGGSNGDGPVKIIQINDNLYYLFNYTYSSDGDVQNNRGCEFWVIKIDSSGQILWENSFGCTTNGEVNRDAILMPDHGLLMMGRITSAGGDVSIFYGETDIWFCCIDSTGSILWEKTFGNGGMENALKIKMTSRNTILMIGGHPEPGGMIDCPFHEGDGTVCDVWIIEMDLRGNLLNQWCYGGSKDDLGWDIVETDGGYVFAASTTSLDGDVTGFHGNSWTYYQDIWVVKIDLFGNIIWQKCLGGSASEWPVYITETEDGGYIVFGTAYSNDGDVTGNHSSSEQPDIWVIKLSSDGQLEWNQCIGSSSRENFWGIHSVLKKGDYDYIIGANSKWADGNVTCDLFPDPYDLTENAWLFEVKDCEYYFPAVPVISSGPDTLCNTTNPIAIYSTDPVQWADGYEWSLEPESAGSVLVDTCTVQVTWNPQFEGMAQIAARSYNNCGISAWSEPKYTMVYPCMGLEEDKGKERQGDKGKLKISPNPTSNIVNCQLSNANGKKDISLVVYDIFGRTALTPITSPSPLVSKSPGQQELSWELDVSTLPPGIYFIVIRDEWNVIGTGKFVVAQ
jgi:hypothetical protein